MDHPHLRGLRYRFTSQPILWRRLARAFHARHRLFLPPRFPPWQNPCENQKPWALDRRRNSGSPCFPPCHLFIRVVEQPCIRKNLQRVDSSQYRRSTGLSSSLPFPQEHRCQLHSLYVHHRMGGLADARTGSVYSVRSKDRRSELTRG